MIDILEITKILYLHTFSTIINDMTKTSNARTTTARVHHQEYYTASRLSQIEQWSNSTNLPLSTQTSHQPSPWTQPSNSQSPNWCTFRELYIQFHILPFKVCSQFSIFNCSRQHPINNNNNNLSGQSAASCGRQLWCLQWPSNGRS